MDIHFAKVFVEGFGTNAFVVQVANVVGSYASAKRLCYFQNACIDSRTTSPAQHFTSVPFGKPRGTFKRRTIRKMTLTESIKVVQLTDVHIDVRYANVRF